MNAPESRRPARADGPRSMIGARQPAVGRTQVCPHCKTTILDSAAICPACLHHLRFNPGGAAVQSQASDSVFRVEGVFRQPQDADSVEYSVLVVVRDDAGQEIARRVVSVGALSPGESRSFQVSVDTSSGSTRPRPVK